MSKEPTSPVPLVVCGGTFDPVHHGHLIAARAVAEARGYRRIVLLPSASPPHKAGACASGADRLEMLRLAVRGDGLFEVSDMELRRPGKSYTFDTLAALRQAHGPDVDVHWIVGADMLADLANWHRAAEVVDQARVIVAMRPPWHKRTDDILEQLARRLGAGRADRLAAGMTETPLIDISSTKIRQRVAAGLSVRYLVCENVAQYIRNKNIYS